VVSRTTQRAIKTRSPKRTTTKSAQ